MDDEKEYAELKQCLEIISDDGDDVTIDATPLSSDKMLKFFDRDDLEVLWILVKAIFEKIKQVDYMDNLLLHNLKIDMKLRRKVTKLPLPSEPIEHVADEFINEEIDDTLVGAIITASSLEAEQDSGNINKTQSKGTHNESSYQGTDSSGGPRCQESMRDTIAQTSVLKLEKRKTTQALEIDSLKTRVKKLKKKQRLRTHKLKRLYKVGLSARVESSDDNEDLARMEIKSAKPKATTTCTTTTNATPITAASTGPKAKGLVIYEQEQAHTPKVSSQQPSQVKVQDKEQRLAEERAQQELEANNALIETWDDVQVKIDADYQLAERLQAEEQQELNDEEKARLTELVVESSKKAEAEDIEGSSKRVREYLKQENAKKQKIDDDKELAKLK
nr:hypothetical protein [Tanacetum cinerariifolium]